MAVVEILEKDRIESFLSDDPVATVEALDENFLGVAGLVSVFASDEARPVNMMVVRWGQRPLGLGSLGLLRAGRVSGLEEIVRALPADRGRYDVLAPFWASPAIAGAFQAEVAGAGAVYVVDRQTLRPSPVVRQTVRLEDVGVIRPVFPKVAEDAPRYVLSLRDQLSSVAAVTHLRQDVARIAVYTVETARGRGFGRGVLTAVADELLSLGVVPSVLVDLGDEGQVRMVEDAGFYQRLAFLRVRIFGEREAEAELGARPIRIGGR